MEKRISINAYFMGLAYMASLRGTCPRRKVGAVLVDENRQVVSTGYNGAPSGYTHCEDIEDGPCVMVEDEDRERCVNTVHGELNAIIHARGKGAILYSTDQPCVNCLKAALSHNPDILIYYLRPYSDAARDVFVDAQGLDGVMVEIPYEEQQEIITLFGELKTK